MTNVRNVLVLGKPESCRSLVWTNIWEIFGATDLVAIVDGVKYTFEPFDMHDEWQLTSDLQIFQRSILAAIGQRMFHAVLFVIDADDLKKNGLALSRFRFRSEVYNSLGIIVTMKSPGTKENPNDLLEMAKASAQSAGVGVYLMSKKSFEGSKETFIKKIRKLEVCFSASELFQSDEMSLQVTQSDMDTYFMRTILLFSKEVKPHSSVVKKTIWGEDSSEITKDHTIYSFKDVHLSNWQFSTNQARVLNESIPFNAILFVINKKDLVANGFPLRKWKFRGEIVSSAFGIIITECSEYEDKDKLKKMMDLDKMTTIGLGVHCISNGFCSTCTTLLQSLKKQGLEFLPSDLFKP